MNIYVPPVSLWGDDGGKAERCSTFPVLWAIATPLAKSPGQRMLLVALTAAAEIRGGWVSIDDATLARQLDLKPDVVTKAIDALEAAGALLRTTKYSGVNHPGMFVLQGLYCDHAPVLPYPWSGGDTPTDAEVLASFWAFAPSNTEMAAKAVDAFRSIEAEAA